MYIYLLFQFFLQIFTYIMDRIVCAILLAVASSLILNLSNAAPQTVTGPLYPATGQAQTQAPIAVVTDAAGRTFNLSPLSPLSPLQPLSPLSPFTAAQQQQGPGRLSFIDSIFKVSDDDAAHHHHLQQQQQQRQEQQQLLRTIRRAVAVATMASISLVPNRWKNASHPNHYPYLIRLNKAY